MSTEPLFPDKPLCGNCVHMGTSNLDPMHGRCPKLNLWVTERTKACKTYYEQKLEADYGVGVG